TAVLPTAGALSRAREHAADGAAWRELDPTDAVLHNVLHAQVQDANHWALGLPLRQLHTWARLAERDVDWERVASTMASAGLDRVLAAYGGLAGDVFGPAPAQPAFTVPAVRRALTFAGAAVGGWPSDLALNLRE